MDDRWQFWHDTNGQWWWRRVSMDNTVISESKQSFPSKPFALVDALHNGWHYGHGIETLDREP